MVTHWIRLGFAHDVMLARFSRPLRRDRRVFVRTTRGVEVATVLASDVLADSEATPLTIIRPTTDNDELLLDRLGRHKVRAVRRCQEFLETVGSSTKLLDVDQLIDGGTLILHFLGDVDQIGQDVADAVVRQYESEVGSIQLSDLMSDGCGDGCGSAGASGCSSRCAGCALAGGCAS
ncbi:MAG: hypothetical protein AAGJ40_04830 [Planctomycetota bacterium]